MMIFARFLEFHACIWNWNCSYSSHISFSQCTVYLLFMNVTLMFVLLKFCSSKYGSNMYRWNRDVREKKNRYNDISCIYVCVCVCPFGHLQSLLVYICQYGLRRVVNILSFVFSSYVFFFLNHQFGKKKSMRLRHPLHT